MSNETLGLGTQVLNMNFKDAQFQVRHRVLLDFVRDRDAKQPMKPLYQGGIFGLKALAEHEMAFDAAGKPDFGRRQVYVLLPAGQESGRVGRGHRSIRPQVHRPLGGQAGARSQPHPRTTMLNLHADTTIHYIAVHLHPYAESLELRDLTTDESLFKSMPATSTTRSAWLTSIRSPAQRACRSTSDHEYEVVSTYNNTSDEDQDSMAVMYMYLLDRDFQRPDAAPVAQR